MKSKMYRMHFNYNNVSRTTAMTCKNFTDDTISATFWNFTIYKYYFTSNTSFYNIYYVIIVYRA